MEKELKIAGMSCHHCVHTVRAALAGVEGLRVEEVHIGGATVVVESGGVTDETIREALEEEGYRLELPA